MSNLGEEKPAGSAPPEIVEAALRAADALGVPVADVPVLAVAQEAGMSRSTLMRRLGGTRRTLDEAVRARGVDPGGRKPVRERAVEAAASLISEHGLASVTLERVAAAARCSVHSLYAVFGGRDELLFAVFERYSPILDVEAVLAGPDEGLEQRVRRIHRLVAEALGRAPRVIPALLAEVLSRPQEPSVQVMAQRFVPRMLDGVGRWLAHEVAAGRIRALPPLLLMQQMMSPVLFHFLMRPVFQGVSAVDLPETETATEVFTQAFLRAVALPEPPPRP
ncbi:TetR/AcrR family transcriptional regulator [Streptomyces sp. TRM 70361]|uniref:TetR/AcrR family transcriptional regulator n=1 Tax=Streptomyces sp. TRM 70361 TaxID=3116553 RepID=UPI002E7C237F|nr:TetR/AcrR family transcriptional regulator [Streptomyces sp. TRM 70361]MEE1940455.1 TetR/AcrR family transcriptional regulator [Streptomyces sp. TRM 70361]